MKAEAYEPWRLHQASDSIDWGRMKGSHRIHHQISKAVELSLNDQVEQGTTLLCQLLRAIHQMSIDNGSWEDASGFLPLGDPLPKPEFACEESELEKIVARRGH